MAAPDFATLFDFETQLEDAATTFLATASGLPESSVFSTLDQDEFTVPRVEVMVEINEGIDPPVKRSTVSDVEEYLNYAATISIRVVTDALQDGTQAAHRAMRGAIRGEMMQNGNNWTTTPSLLPFYSVQYQRPMGTSYEIDGDLAVSTLTYDIRFAIKNDAWPA